ncbi:MAG: Phosphate starvation-inducible protein PhoH, predicted ATPase, partial [uncultured Acidimicrobiales bacterium]
GERSRVPDPDQDPRARQPPHGGSPGRARRVVAPGGEGVRRHGDPRAGQRDQHHRRPRRTGRPPLRGAGAPAPAGPAPRRVRRRPHHRHGQGRRAALRGPGRRGAALLTRSHRAPQDQWPAPVRRRHRQQHGHLRHRPGRHRQVLPGRRPRRAGPAGPHRQPHHPHPPGRGGGGAPGLPAGRRAGQGRPLPAPALRRPLRHARPRGGQAPARGGDHRGRPSGLHAGPHAQRQLPHPRRGPEHHARADEDVPHPHRLRLPGRGHRRRHPGRPPGRSKRPAGPGGDPHRHRRPVLRAPHVEGRGPAPDRPADRRRLRARQTRVELRLL